MRTWNVPKSSVLIAMFAAKSTPIVSPLVPRTESTKYVGEFLAVNVCLLVRIVEVVGDCRVDEALVTNRDEVVLVD